MKLQNDARLLFCQLTYHRWNENILSQRRIVEMPHIWLSTKVPLRLCFKCFGEILRNGFAGYRHAVAMQEAVFQQRLHEQWNAADLEQVLRHIAPAGLEVGDVGRALEDLGDVEEAFHKMERGEVLRSVVTL